MPLTNPVRAIPLLGCSHSRHPGREGAQPPPRIAACRRTRGAETKLLLGTPGGLHLRRRAHDEPARRNPSRSAGPVVRGGARAGAGSSWSGQRSGLLKERPGHCDTDAEVTPNESPCLFIQMSVRIGFINQANQVQEHVLLCHPVSTGNALDHLFLLCRHVEADVQTLSLGIRYPCQGAAMFLVCKVRTVGSLSEFLSRV